MPIAQFPPVLKLLDVGPFVASQEASVQIELLVSTTLSTLRSIWASSWGSRIENVLRFALKSLALANLALVREDHRLGPNRQYTLLEVVPLLTLHTFRRRVLERVEDALVLEWWHTYYERLDPVHLNDVITPIVTKISAYASSTVARRILGQPSSTLDLSQVVAQGEILLVSTAAGQVGTDVSSLLGATLLSRFGASLAQQFGLPQPERRPFLVLVDEFRTYPVDYGYLLSELRKAGLSLVLAAQSLSQLDAFDLALRPTVLGNTEQQFFFTLTGEDAYLLRHELSVSPEDVMALPDDTCSARWSKEGKRLPLFSFRLLPPPSGDESVTARLRTNSALRDGRPETEIDALIEQAHRFHHPPPPSKSAHASLKVIDNHNFRNGPVNGICMQCHQMGFFTAVSFD